MNTIQPIKDLITITDIDAADPDCSTDVVNVVTLSDGRRIEIWSGQTSYDVHDIHTGPLTVGSRLIGVSTKTTYDDRPFQEFHFA